MADIFQTTFQNACPKMKMYEFRLRSHWSLFPRVQYKNNPLYEPMAASLLSHVCVIRSQWVNKSVFLFIRVVNHISTVSCVILKSQQIAVESSESYEILHLSWSQCCQLSGACISERFSRWKEISRFRGFVRFTVWIGAPSCQWLIHCPKHHMDN